MRPIYPLFLLFFVFLLGRPCKSDNTEKVELSQFGLLMWNASAAAYSNGRFEEDSQGNLVPKDRNVGCGFWNDTTRLYEEGNYAFTQLMLFNDTKTDTQGGIFFYEPKKIVIVAFRGTDGDATDIQTDTNVKLIECNLGGDCGKLHNGFSKAYDSVKNWIKKELEPFIKDKYLVFFTGHSLGGALATLSAYHFAYKYQDTLSQGGKPTSDEWSIGVVTFGSPKVGDSDFRDAYQEYVPFTTRFVNGKGDKFKEACDDVVSTVPPEIFPRYKHVVAKHSLECFSDCAALSCHKLKSAYNTGDLDDGFGITRDHYSKAVCESQQSSEEYAFEIWTSNDSSDNDGVSMVTLLVIMVGCLSLVLLCLSIGGAVMIIRNKKRLETKLHSEELGEELLTEEERQEADGGGKASRCIIS